MKTLTAEKVKDGWVVKITETIIASHKDDVLKEIRQQGLKIVDPPELRDNPVVCIYAD